MKILFLCTGNTCRSVIAEALMKEKVAGIKADIKSESAGVSAFTGDRASEKTIEVMRERGIDVSSHRSRRLSEYMTEEYDLVVCMDKEHKDAASSLFDEKKLMILGGGIWDPQEDDLKMHRLCADKISRELDALINKLTEVQIHPMTEADISDIAEIEKECFSRPWSEKAIADELKNDSAIFFVAELMGEKVGYMGMHTVLDECYIANVAVRESFRRKGIGRSLLRYGERLAKERNCSFISLEVRVSNENAINLYSAEGYEKMGERKNFYSEPTENALIMTKNLISDKE